MRNTLLASAALLGLAIGAPAYAQTDTMTAPPPAATVPATPAPAVSGATEQAPAMKPHPVRVHASNIGQGDTSSTIAPALPVPPLGPNATPQQFLQQAQMALQHHRSGEAQEALERAETRMLDRSTMPSDADQPDMSPMIKQIADARDALGKRDWRQASQLIDDMLKNPNIAASGGDMNGSGMTNPTMTGSRGSIGANMNAGAMTAAPMPADTGTPGSAPPPMPQGNVPDTMNSTPQ